MSGNKEGPVLGPISGGAGSGVSLGRAPSRQGVRKNILVGEIVVQQIMELPRGKLVFVRVSTSAVAMDTHRTHHTL
jgi:hypothetical protein